MGNRIKQKTKGSAFALGGALAFGGALVIGGVSQAESMSRPKPPTTTVPRAISKVPRASAKVTTTAKMPRIKSKAPRTATKIPTTTTMPNTTTPPVTTPTTIAPSITTPPVVPPTTTIASTTTITTPPVTTPPTTAPSITTPPVTTTIAPIVTTPPVAPTTTTTTVPPSTTTMPPTTTVAPTTTTVPPSTTTTTVPTTTTTTTSTTITVPTTTTTTTTTTTVPPNTTTTTTTVPTTTTTTTTTTVAPYAGVSLGSAASYSVIAGTAFTEGAVNTISGATLWAGAGATSGPWKDASDAYNNASGRTPTVTSAATGFQTAPLTAGVYRHSAFIWASGTLTLDGQGDPNAVFIFQISGYLTTEVGFQVVLTNGANANNIFWQVGSYFSPGASTIFKGTVAAETYVTTGVGLDLDGRLFALNGAITTGASNIIR